MQIGTALTNSAFKVMFLGGGELGKEVVIAMQRLGVETIVVDRYADSPAMQVAHHSHVINMIDKNALENIILSVKPHIIVPEIEAIATEVLLNIEKENLAQVIPNARAVNITMNRESIRKLAAEELQLPTSQYKFANNLEELKSACLDIGFPCFIKPIMSSSGKGQSMIKDITEVENAWNTANNSGRVQNCTVIIEAKIDFDFEITLLTVRAKNASGVIETYFCNPIGHKQISGDYVESWQPQSMTPVALQKSQAIAQEITANLGGVGIFGVELFIRGDDVYFSEVSPRPHDTGMVTMITQYQNEFELHARSILGLPVDTTQKEIGASSVIYAGMDGVGLSFSNLEKSLAIPKTDLRIFGKPEGFKKRRMGVALAYADTVENARTNAVMASQLVQVS